MKVRDSTARHLHIWGPPGSGKTTLLLHKAVCWLAEEKVIILVVGDEFYDVPLVDAARVLREKLQNENSGKIRNCRNFCEILRERARLKSKFPKAEVCVIIDTLTDTSLLNQLLHDVRSGQLSHVWSTSWKNLHSDATDFSKKAVEIGWESIHLPDCFRCTDDTVELLNKLGYGVFPPMSSCSVPRDQDTPAWRVVDHCLHPDHVNTVTSCGHCKQEMSAALPSMKEGLEWNDWIALHTGDPSVFVNCGPLKEALVFCGMPVSYDSDSYRRHETDVASSESRRVTSTSDFARFRERVTDGVDEHGQPIVHLLQVEDFRGMERDGVILVHWDERDNDPGHQSQKERATRLEEHRHQWIQAASRSKDQVFLLQLSPSPARSLLELPEVPLP